MTGELDDWERGVVDDPHAPPQALADIAARRWDLHPAIAVHPRVYPELRQWMATVNPAPAAPAPHVSTPAAPAPYAPTQPASSAQYYPIAVGQPVPPPRRNGIGYWLAGCGCLAVVGILFVVLLVFVSLGSLTPSGRGDAPPAQSGADEIAENIAAYEAELETIHTLSADFEGNPVAPLILDQPRLDELATEASDPELSVFGSRSLVQAVSGIRKNLEPLIAAAAQRRANASGSVSEALVDEAGNGYIDIAWDAADFCGGIESEDKVAVACPLGGASPAIHIMAESYYPSAAAVEHVVIHELAHIYQSADSARFEDSVSEADRLIAQGLFNSSRESMADCYALTYQNLWTLAFGDRTYGYGYVCNDAERQEIRNWAASLHAPMPG